MCDGCYAHYCDGWGDDSEGAASNSVRVKINEALDNGWTTDGDSLHCTACPPLELRGITEAIAMKHRYGILSGLIAVSIESA